MHRDSRASLEDIVTAAERIATYVSGYTRESFGKDSRTVDAVVRNLEVIGAAVKHLPGEVRVQAPAVEWSRIAGLGEVLTQASFRVDIDIPWHVVTRKVPDLANGVKTLLGNN